MSAPPDLRFPIPQRRRDTASDMDLTPKGVKSWIAALPLGSPEPCAARLFDALVWLNRTEVPDSDRLGFLEPLGAAAATVSQALHDSLRDVAAPPRQRELKRAELAIRLHDELALAYRGACGCQGERRLFRKSAMPDTPSLLLAALRELSACLRAHYLIGVRPRGNLWERIYAVYDMARSMGAADQGPPASAAARAESLQDVFKGTLLLSLAAPAGLRGLDIERLHQLLHPLRSAALLRPATAGTVQEPRFVVPLSTDRPPLPTNTGAWSDTTAEQGWLELDVQPMLEAIRTHLTRARSADPAGGSTRDRRLLRWLLTKLGPERKRKTRRVPGASTVQVMAGLRWIHQYLTDGPPPPKPPPRPAPKARDDHWRPAGNIGYNVVLNLEYASIDTGQDADAQDTEPPFLNDLVEHRVATCHTVDVSVRGYGLATRDTEKFRIKTGELVAVREAEQPRWLPGRVTWVSTDGTQVNFGVRLLAPRLSAAKALCLGSNDTRATECLLLQEEGEALPSRLLISPRCLKSGTRLLVEAPGRRYEIALGKELSRTHGYAEFACQVSAAVEDEPVTTPLFGRDAGSDDAPDEPTDPAGAPGRRPWKKYL